MLQSIFEPHWRLHLREAQNLGPDFRPAGVPVVAALACRDGASKCAKFEIPVFKLENRYFKLENLYFKLENRDI